VIGVDVSNHQGDIDWPLLARTDIAFAYLKALDLEDMGTCRSGPMVANLVEEIVTALSMLEAHYGRRPLLYVTSEFDAAYLRGYFTTETFWARSLQWLQPAVPCTNLAQTLPSQP